MLAYVVFATVFAFAIGRPLIRYSFRNELTNAAFRYALVRLRDSAEAIGFYRGEPAERGILRSRFMAVIANYRRFVVPTLYLLGWNNTMSQIVTPLPLVVQAPRLFAGQIKLGDVTQSASASSTSTTRWPSSAVSTTRSPAIAPPSSGSTDWSTPINRRGISRGSPQSRAPTAHWNCAMSRCASPTASCSSTTWIFGWHPARRW